MKRALLIMTVLIAVAFLSKCSVNENPGNPIGNIEKLIAGKDL